MRAIGELYGRLAPVMRAAPLALILPFAAELLQHAVEVRMGMYAEGGLLAAARSSERMLFGIVKVLTLFATVLFLWRWWAMGGDSARALRPGRLFFRGLATMIAIQLGGELVLTLLSGQAAAALGGEVSRGGRLALTFVPLLVWMFFVALLYPWFVGMIVEDRAMTAGRSVAVMKRRLFWAFGLLLAGVLPLMVVHYALGYGAMGHGAATLWAMLLIDAGLVAVMTVLIASTWFTLYARAVGQVEPG